MAYSAAILARAKARLAAAREQNAQDDAARIGAIYERLPRLRRAGDGDEGACRHAR